MKYLFGMAALVLALTGAHLPALAQGQKLQELQERLNQLPPASRAGAAIWEERCASCHDHPTDRAPPRLHLQHYRTPEQV